MTNNSKMVAYLLDTEMGDIDTAEVLFQQWKIAQEEYNTLNMAYDTMQKKQQKKGLTKDEEKQMAWIFLAREFAGAKVQFAWDIAFEVNEIEGYAFQEMVKQYQKR